MGFYFRKSVYLFIFAFIIFAYLDNKRKNTIIFYDIDEETESRLQQFYDSFDEITNCKRKWRKIKEELIKIIK